jgi:site-specific DNA recombinase
MMQFLGRQQCNAILVEKTDRLYRNIKDWVLVDELGIDIHFVKENVIVGP